MLRLPQLKPIKNNPQDLCEIFEKILQKADSTSSFVAGGFISLQGKEALINELLDALDYENGWHTSWNIDCN